MNKHNLTWLRENATSISDTEKRKESFREITHEIAGDKLIRFYIDQQGQYRYESTKK